MLTRLVMLASTQHSKNNSTGVSTQHVRAAPQRRTISRGFPWRPCAACPRVGACLHATCTLVRLGLRRRRHGFPTPRSISPIKHNLRTVPLRGGSGSMLFRSVLSSIHCSFVGGFRATSFTRLGAPTRQTYANASDVGGVLQESSIFSTRPNAAFASGSSVSFCMTILP